jgi:putative protease
VKIEAADVPFLPISSLNSLRRELIDKLRKARAANRPTLPPFAHKHGVDFPNRILGFEANVLNKKAAELYRRHGVVEIEPAAESGLDMRGHKLMTTRYCLKYELGVCGQRAANEPLALIDDDGNRLELRFDCARCEMRVYLGAPPRERD